MFAGQLRDACALRPFTMMPAEAAVVSRAQYRRVKDTL